MMTGRRNQLQEKYEDALFALMMDDYLRQQGQQAFDENERLKESNEIEISQNIDKRIRNQIKRLSHVTSRKHSGKSIAVIAKRVGIVLCAAVILTMTAFAAFPELKIGVMNWWVQITDEFIDFHFKESNSNDMIEDPEDESIAQSDGFTVSWIPDGFTLESETILPDFVTEYKYISTDDSYFYVMKVVGDGTTFSIDTEDAEMRNIKMHGKDAIFTKKGGEITITWEEPEQAALMRVVAVGISEEELMKIAEGVQLI